MSNNECLRKNIVIIPKQACASYPEHCDNTKLRPVPLHPNQASASSPKTGQCLYPLKKYMEKAPLKIKRPKKTSYEQPR